MKSFLNGIAEAYCRNESAALHRYCFIFPNKRAGLFFAKELTEVAKKPTLGPAVMTMSDWVTRQSPLVQPDRLDLLIMLYEEYCKLTATKDDTDFDHFRSWGEMLLDDFSEIDKWLVDPESIFSNIREYDEIRSTYLTAEQLAILSEFWADRLPEAEELSGFWRHIHKGSDEDHNPESDHNRFVALWEMLYPLYEALNIRLEAEGMATEGMIYRRAAENIAQGESRHFDRYIFVGFSNLTLSEIKIMNALHRRNLADFYWDTATQIMHVEGNRALRYINRWAEKLPSRYPLPTPSPSQTTTVEVVACPANIGQTRLAGSKLEEWIEQGFIHNPADATDTAVVLPDEDLLLPLTHELPSAITSLNVTMGLPFSKTPLAAVMNAVVALHLNARREKGVLRYFVRDVKALLLTPSLRALDPTKADAMLSEIRQRRLYRIDANTFEGGYGIYAPLFAEVADENDVDAVYACFTGVISLMRHAFECEGEEANTSIFGQFLSAYQRCLDDLHASLIRHHISVTDTTFMRMLERQLRRETVSLTGRPLQGLQVMGMLETRALDFNNLIVLSMNERIYPRRYQPHSFIPENLRHAFGLPTANYYESSQAYNFYRLLGRARHVTLYYDSRTVGANNGDMSRYLAQMLYLADNSLSITHRAAIYPVTTTTPPVLAVKKTSEVMAKLQRYTLEGSDSYLSPSAIHQFQSCPLRFYLNYVEQRNLDEEDTSFIDSSTYGNIVHEAMQRIYEGFARSNPGADITAGVIDRMIENADTVLMPIVARSINKNYNGKDLPATVNDFTGECKLMARIILNFVIAILKNEKPYTPFRFLEAEKKCLHRWHVNDSLTVNLKFVIDRIDSVSGANPTTGAIEESLRFIDYKTGADLTSFTSIAQLFDKEDPKLHRKAISQLLFYCHFYALEYGYNGRIQPIIYPIKSLRKDQLTPIMQELPADDTRKKKSLLPLTDYRDFDEEYIDNLRSLVEEIFAEGEFRQADDTDACRYCSFKPICGRTISND